MGNDLNAFAKTFDKIINSLLLEGPKTTGLGSLLGAVILGLTKGFSPVISQSGITRIFDPFQIPTPAYLALGVLIANGVAYLKRRKEGDIPKEIKEKFAVIDKTKSDAKLTATETKDLYIKVIEDYFMSNNKVIAPPKLRLQ